MYRSSRVAIASCFLVAPTLAGTPTLDHTAPRLGEVVTITMAGVTPGAAVGLLFSPQAAEITLPLGTLELSPIGLDIVASGTASPSGDWSIDFPIPMSANWAEIEAHLQGIEVDAGAPGGGVLSIARHLRFLGSRVYAHVGGSPPGSKLLAFSAVTDEEVFVFDLPDEMAGDAQVVHNENDSVGALVVGEGAASELVFFDSFFGGVLQTVATTGTILAVDPSGSSFFVYSDASDTLERVSFTGATLQTIAVPGGGSQVAVDDALSEAFVSTLSGTRPAVLRVDLTAGTVSSPIELGRASDTLLKELQWAGGYVIATTASSGAGPFLLNQLDVSGPAATLIGTDTGVAGASGTLAVPAAGLVLTWHDESQDPFAFEPWEMVSVPLGATGPVESIVAPVEPSGSGVVDTHRWVTDGTDVWFTDRCCQEYPDGDESGAVWKLDALAATWTTTPNNLFEGPHGVVVIDDAFGSRVFVERGASAPLGFGEAAKLIAIDKGTLATATFEYTTTDSLWSFGLTAVPVP